MIHHFQLVEWLKYPETDLDQPAVEGRQFADETVFKNLSSYIILYTVASGGIRYVRARRRREPRRQLPHSRDIGSHHLSEGRRPRA